MNQGDFAARVVVSDKTLRSWEQGKTAPDLFQLERLDDAGCDVLYIVTGYRSGDALPAEHQNLVEAYMAASEDLRRAAFAVLLSPWKKGIIDKPMKEPGYFQYEVRGVDDARYEHNRVHESEPAPYANPESEEKATPVDTSAMIRNAINNRKSNKS
jgi:transcriptional regulator with XRE-family HTH domain